MFDLVKVTSSYHPYENLPLVLFPAGANLDFLFLSSSFLKLDDLAGALLLVNLVFEFHVVPLVLKPPEVAVELVDVDLFTVVLFGVVLWSLVLVFGVLVQLETLFQFETLFVQEWFLSQTLLTTGFLSDFLWTSIFWTNGFLVDFFSPLKDESLFTTVVGLVFALISSLFTTFGVAFLTTIFFLATILGFLAFSASLSSPLVESNLE